MAYECLGARRKIPSRRRQIRPEKEGEEQRDCAILDYRAINTFESQAESYVSKNCKEVKEGELEEWPLRCQHLAME